MHKELYIARGVMKTPGDTLSAETGLDAVNLMDVNGFALDPAGGWQPQIAGMKNGGVWADSNINTGRLLIAGADGNVTETIRLTITTGDVLSLYVQITRLSRFIQDCREMWTTFHQIEPVFLWWWAVGAPGRQYALVFNIDMAVTYPDVEQGATADITLTLEREPYWRALPPGVNPKIWAYEARHENMDSAADYKLDSGTTEHFAYDAAVCNRMEFSTSSLATITARNYIDIDGSDIPGDAPALVCMAVTAAVSGASLLNMYVARTTSPRSLVSRDTGGTIPNYPLMHMFNACNGDLGSDTITAADTGGVRDYAGNQERVQISFATVATLSSRVLWGLPEGVSMAALRGKYAAFVRARQVNGAAGDIEMNLFIEPPLSAEGITLQTTNPTLLGTNAASTGANGGWPLTYMGELTLPIKGETVISSDGNGASVDSGINISLMARRISGVGVLYVCDLILMPFEEYFCLVTGDDNLFDLESGTTESFVGDETGYLAHGLLDVITQTNHADAGGAGAIQGSVAYNTNELRGQWPRLTPGVNNRLLFLMDGEDSNRSVTATELIVRMNIIPRWKGIRDV